jgi:ABC-type uncharacterized transport system ATPase subunit
MTSVAPEPEEALRLEGITKRFGAMVANDAISLVLHKGEVLGLLGENGAGKTTLMNILFGHYVADAGSIVVNGKPLPSGNPSAALAAGIGMVHQHFTLADNLTVLENIMLGTESLFSLRSKTAGARQRLSEIAIQYGLEVNPDAKVASLSVGEKQRVEILKALFRNVRILILDEPTAVLTPQESLALLRALQRFAHEGLSIILISHKLGEVLAGCSRIVVLRGGKVAGEKKSKATTRAELSELMVGRAIVPPRLDDMPRGAPHLSLKDVRARRDGRELEKITFDLHKHEILGLVGVSGNGQSLLADVLSGTLKPRAGSLKVMGSEVDLFSPAGMMARGIARMPEDRHVEGSFADMSVTENMIAERYRSAAFSRRGWINWHKARDEAKNQIEKYDIKCPSPSASVRLLSGGNMQKIILSRVLAGAPKVIVANQPTRGLDVGAVSFVHEQLLAARRRGAAILLISEDLDEILSLSDRICVMYRGRMTEPMWRAEVKFAELGLLMAGQTPEKKAETNAA